jgi:transposase
MLKTEDWSFLRRLHVQEGKSMRWIAREFKLSRNTVAKYVQDGSPPRYKLSKPRVFPVLEPFKEFIVQTLESDKTAPAKQRHTAKRIYERLVSEKAYSGSEPTVRRFVAQWCQRSRSPKIFIPLEFPPGKQAQVDFGDVYVCVGCPQVHLAWNMRGAACSKVPIKLQCFVMRLSYSRRLFVMCFPSANMSSFIAAHRLAFEYFGCRPKQLVYDNLSLAVRKVLRGREREVTQMFGQLAGHYGFEHHFCTPGKEGAHEKGGVEEGIGFVRRNWFTPVIHVKDLEELNAYLLDKCQQDMSRTVAIQPCSIAEAWEMEKEYMIKLPATGMDACVVEPATLDHYGMVRYDKNFYSIPDSIKSQKLWVKAYWDRIEITNGSEAVASHRRCYRKKERIFEPAHYFNLLERRPGAVRFAKPLLSHPWPEGYWQFYEEMVKARGTSNSGKEFIRVLRMHNQYGSEATALAVLKALELGARGADAVHSILVAKTRPLCEAVPLDLTKREHLAEYQVLAIDLRKFQALAGGEENDRESVA